MITNDQNMIMFIESCSGGELGCAFGEGACCHVEFICL